MTTQKHLKQLVRARMQKTGEAYTTARRHVTSQAASPDNRHHHFAGSTPAATALRSLLSAAGVIAPHTKQPFSEAMVYGIAGGIGAGVFAFHYEKENFSSFFIAGRHQWQDHKAWALAAADRFGVKALVREASGAGPADKHLRELLATGRPAMVWLDLFGRMYHVATVHEIDDDAGVATIGDASDALIPMPLDALASARGRTKKDKHRALTLEPARKLPPLKQLVREGIDACVSSLTTCKMKNFRLEAFDHWGDKLDGSNAADSWAKVFAPGPLMFMGLRSVTEYIDYYGTGGGLSRPLFAEFLGEAADALDDTALRELSTRYAGIGRGWSALADAALPDDVPVFRQAKELLQQRSEALATETAHRAESADSCAKAIAEATTAMKDGFPLSADESVELRRALKSRVKALYADEVAALDGLARWVVR